VVIFFASKRFDLFLNKNTFAHAFNHQSV